MTSIIHFSKPYRKVLEHRRTCKKWGKKFCLECFGGGLSKFVDELHKEKTIVPYFTENNSLLSYLKKAPKNRTLIFDEAGLELPSQKQMKSIDRQLKEMFKNKMKSQELNVMEDS